MPDGIWGEAVFLLSGAYCSEQHDQTLDKCSKMSDNTHQWDARAIFNLSLRGEKNKMPAKYPSDIFEQGRALLEAWKSIDGPPAVGDLVPAALEAELTAIGPIYAQVDALEAQLTSLRNERDALSESIWDKVKRVRTGVKGIFGDDSSEYEIVGGTRLSDRKPNTRKRETG